MPTGLSEANEPAAVVTKYNPDRLYFITTAAGSFASDNPVGTLNNFGGSPPADFGWEILTAQDVDLSITVSDGVATAFPGGSVVYTITASNAGPDTVFGARVADTFPAVADLQLDLRGQRGDTCAASGSGDINDATVDLAVGGSVTYTATCADLRAATGTLDNTAAIFAPGTAVEANLADNNSRPTATRSVASADLAITKTDGVTTATPGGSVTYTITASNAGPSDATGATVADTFPASLTCTWTCVGAGGGTCTAAGSGNINDTVNLPAGGSVTYTASCTIAAAATGTLSNTATVAAPAGVTDPDAGQQLGDRQRHAGRIGGPRDHQDRRRDDGDAGRQRHLHHHREQRRPEQCDRRHRGRHLPGFAHLYLDLCRCRRRHLHGSGQRQRQRHGEPAGRRQRDLHGELHDRGRGHRHAVEHGDGRGARRRHRSDAGQQLGHRQRHAGRIGGPRDHQDRRRDDGDAGRQRHLHASPRATPARAMRPAPPWPTPSRLRSPVPGPASVPVAAPARRRAAATSTTR